jgi:bifunctional NMN adenylyltransferase/nudix hydrolase
MLIPSVGGFPMNLAVYIGKFSPFHNGHESVIKRALENYHRVLVIVGSANQPRTPRLPWTDQERIHMIRRWYREEVRDVIPKLYVTSVRDYWYQDQQWAAAVMSAVNAHISENVKANDQVEVSIIGAQKDWSAYYLNLFPAYKKDLVKDGQISTFSINATTVRELYFAKPEAKFYAGEVPLPVVDLLEDFKKTEHFEMVKKEDAYYHRYKSEWAMAPYPPIFLTVDAVVIQGGHVLLVQRKTAPGKGCYALPGGFIKENEAISSAVVRELREETRLKVPVPILMGCMRGREVFDDPNRSLRGRTITNAFLFHLNETGELHEVKGGSDANKALWVPLSDLEKMEPMMFEDHIGIIQKMIGLL